MKTTYEESVDALYVTLAAPRGRLVTREVGPGIYLDFDQRKALVGIEIAGRADLEPLLERMSHSRLRIEPVPPGSALFTFLVT